MSPSLFAKFFPVFLIISFVLNGCGSTGSDIGPSLVKKTGPSVSTVQPSSTNVPSVEDSLAKYIPAGFSIYGSLRDPGPASQYLKAAPVNLADVHLLRASLPTSMTTGTVE